MGLSPNHHNKMMLKLSKSHKYFGKVRLKSDAYSRLSPIKCANSIMCKKQCADLSQKILHCYKIPVSFESSVNLLILLVEGFASVLMASDRSRWWLLKAVVAWQFLEIRLAMKLATTTNSSFHKHSR